eukprot:scaffold6894_cov104-Isochrysis_galbana.AAC.5
MQRENGRCGTSGAARGRARGNADSKNRTCHRPPHLAAGAHSRRRPRLPRDGRGARADRARRATGPQPYLTADRLRRPA